MGVHGLAAYNDHLDLDITDNRCWDGHMKISNRSLCVAAKDGNIAKIKSALAAGADIHENEESALGFAVCYGKVEVVHLLLVAVADARARNAAALCTAAVNGHAEVVRLLLAAGADVRATHRDAMRNATARGYAEVVADLIAAGADPRLRHNVAIQSAAYYGRTNVVRVILQANRNAAAKDKHGRYRADYNSALCWAIAIGHVAVARLIIAASADIVMAWSMVAPHERPLATKTIDACVDALTPEQRAVLAKASEPFVRLRAAVAAANQQQPLRRRASSGGEYAIDTRHQARERARVKNHRK